MENCHTDVGVNYTPCYPGLQVFIFFEFQGSSFICNQKKNCWSCPRLTCVVASFFSRGGPAILVGSGVVLLYISAGLSLWSFVVYTREICKVLRR